MKKKLEINDKRYDVELVTRQRMNGVPEDYTVTVLKACAGTEYGSQFDAEDFLKSLGLEVQDGDEVAISAKVTQRRYVERRPPTKEG